MDYQDVLTTSQAAKLMGISVRTAQLLIESGALASWKTPGGHRRVRRADVLAHMAQAVPVPRLSSALVVVIASPARQPRFESLLSAVPECTVEVFGDLHTAALAIGSRLPAAVVVDVERPDVDRVQFLQRLAAHPALGRTPLVAIGRVDAAAALPPHVVHLAAVGELPQALQLVLRDADDTPERPLSSASYPVAANERQRLAALERAGLLATPPEAAFDRLTWLASRSLKTPIALLTLLAPTRQWFKSRVGLEMSETPRSWAFCNETILQRGVFVVDDLTRDPRFAANPTVAAAPAFRFYAGAPVLDADGFALGSLCVMDYEPRHLEAEQEQMLLSLAALASDEVQLRATDRQLRWTRDALDRERRRHRPRL